MFLCYKVVVSFCKISKRFGFKGRAIFPRWYMLAVLLPTNNLCSIVSLLCIHSGLNSLPIAQHLDQCAVHSNMSLLFSFNHNPRSTKHWISSILQCQGFFFWLILNSWLNISITPQYSCVVNCNENDKNFVYSNSMSWLLMARICSATANF